ncbi:MAG: transcriptional repressor [Spirochaetaceae bacterium]|nr:transcriptional repressor [Spirochaetaceae bacterium]
MKCTAQIRRKRSGKREAILEVIRKTKTHPAARWVYEELKPHIPGLSLGTVYRNIGLFREEGAVVSVGVVAGEERFDAVTAPHPHQICERCGKVLDLPAPGETMLTPLAEMAGENGFTADYRKTVFYGLCRECVAGG